MNYKYYLVIREQLGQVIVCMTKGLTSEYAHLIVSNSFKESSGRYLTMEITEKEYNRHHYNYKVIGKFKFRLANQYETIEGKEIVYVLAHGSLNAKMYFKEEAIDGG